MRIFSVNARYLIVPIMSLLTIGGILLGDTYTWLGVILFGVCTVADIATRNIHRRADFAPDGRSYGVKYFQYGVMYFMLPVFITLQLALAWQIHKYASSASEAVSVMSLI